MILITPINRVCEGKSTKHPVTKFAPFLWLKTTRPNFTVVSIDGYIIDETHAVNGIFKKAEYINEVNEKAFDANLIFNIFSKNEIKIIKYFADTFDSGLYTFVWPKDYPQGFDVSEKLIHSIKFSFSNNDITIDSVKVISLYDLEEGIFKLRRFSFRTVKGLNAASSNVECFLANKTK